MRRLILASSSTYRQTLLGKITSNFEAISPNFKEDHAVFGELPQDCAARLARGKAESVAEQQRQQQESAAVIIGSDQVAALEPEQSGDAATLLHKPGTLEPAVSALLSCSGKIVNYHSAVHVIDTATQRQIALLDSYQLEFRRFSRAEAVDYCLRDQPYDCAGAIKTESLGVNLIAAYRGSDPHTLIGLPLIKLRAALAELDALPELHRQ